MMKAEIGTEVGTELGSRINKPVKVTRTCRKRATQKRAELEELIRQNSEPEIAEYIDKIKEIRPTNRTQCAEGHRPCLFVACKHNLYLDVNQETGSIKFNFPEKEVCDMNETCALDVAARGGITLEEVGEILNLTRERIRQVEVKGLTKLRHYSRKSSLADFTQ